MYHGAADMTPDIRQHKPHGDTWHAPILNDNFSLRYYQKDAGYSCELDKMIIHELTIMNRPSAECPLTKIIGG